MQSPVLQARGLGVGLTTPPRKKDQVMKTSTNENQTTHLVDEGASVMGSMTLPSQTRKGARRLIHLMTPKKIIHVGTWNVQTMIQAGKKLLPTK